MDYPTSLLLSVFVLFVPYVAILGKCYLPQKAHNSQKDLAAAIRAVLFTFFAVNKQLYLPFKGVPGIRTGGMFLLQRENTV
jgi:hypothetical protein